MKIVFLVFSFILSLLSFNDLDINAFPKLPSEAYTVITDERLVSWTPYKVTEIKKDILTYFTEIAGVELSFKLMVNGESHIVIVDPNSIAYPRTKINAKAGFIKWKSYNNNFMFSDTTTITTSFKDEYIKMIMPKFKGKIIISDVKEIILFENYNKLRVFMGLKINPDQSKENL